MIKSYEVQNAGDYPDDWCLLRHRLWPDTALDDHRAELQDVCENGAGFIVHDPDGSAIGFAEASLRRDYVNGCDTSPVAFLEGIYVEEAYRRQGVAAALVTEVTRWAIAQGVSELASDAEIANLSSHRMHAALGFEETERVVYFRRRLAP
ncbi:aminoglycoside 6'-N-acetyltransferase [Agrobacterium tumefaciens]|uniref:Aminoglycoside N(6')-acetyltransferase type 1 n=1 Tax=Agrobacterium tumefaciens TaxID=358 RepID=A0A176WZU2_AGRTU|nr:aminoglycoside 6'-N-acetyltransferase [Agrobacterium tumefaciens]OAE39493.1 aminoglycoside 6'-acetyltransferase [Agrobacterium tumefaciens]